MNFQKTKREILEVKYNITVIRNAIKGLEDKAIEITQKLKQRVKVKWLGCVRLFATPWTIAYQAPPSVHGIFQARVLEWVAISFSRGIFLTQGWNSGLLNCRQTLLPSETPGKSRTKDEELKQKERKIRKQENQRSSRRQSRNKEV